MVNKLKNTLFLSSISLLSKAIGTIFTMSICARFISLEEFGVLSFAILLSTLLALWVDFGFPLKLPKEIAKVENKFQSLTSLSIQIKLRLLIPFILVTFCVFFFTSSTFIYIVIIYSSVFYSFFYNIMSAYRGADLFKLEATQSLLSELFFSVLVGVVAWQTLSIEAIALAILLGRFCQMSFVLIYFYHVYGFLRLNVSIKDFNECIPYAVQLMVAALLIYLDSLILKWFVQPEDFGLYQVGIRLLIAAGLFINILNAVAIPRLSFAYSQSNGNFQYLVKNTILISLMLGILGGCVFYLFAEEIIFLMFGERYLALAQFKIYIALIIFIRYCGAIFGVILTVCGDQKVRAKSLTLTVVLVGIFGVLFIPIHGVLAAYYVSLLGTVFLCYLYIKNSICYIKFK